VLIQQVASTVFAPLIAYALGFGSAEPRAVDLGVLRRLLARHARLKSLQVDDLAEDRLPARKCQATVAYDSAYASVRMLSFDLVHVVSGISTPSAAAGSASAANDANGT
jgi:hypothetical protein